MVGTDFITLTERAHYNITVTIEDFIPFTHSYVKEDAEWLLKCKYKNTTLPDQFQYPFEYL